MTHTYIYLGDRLVCEEWGSCYIYYIYDETDRPYGLIYCDGTNTDYYYFLRNLQGDVIELLAMNGETIAYYEYDAWGKLLSVKDASGNAITSATHIANINPIRYRGYYYDTESGFYYLRSRYYDPEICRFINPDAYVSTGQGVLGYNMFAYCENEPINAFDPSGSDAIWLQDTNLVYSFGHTGLLLQDNNGSWWHFYWGNNRDGNKGKKGNGKILLPYAGELNLESINRLYYEQYGNMYEKMIYFEGDFSSSVNYAKKLNNYSYNLLFNNCMQVSTDVLRKGRFAYSNLEYKALLLKIRSNTIPNVAFEKMMMFTGIVSVWHATPWYFKGFVCSPIKAVMYL